MNGNNLEINVDNATVLDVKTESINSELDRQDKSVSVVDSNGNATRTSSIMMGYNRKGIVLNDGTYVTEEKLKEAILSAIANVTDGEVVVKRTGLKVKPEDINTLIDLVKASAGSIVIGNSSDKVTNQDSVEWGLRGNNGTTINKGVAFLGNRGIVLDSGEYINLEELQKVISEYLGIVVPNKEENVVAPPSFERTNLQEEIKELQSNDEPEELFGYVRDKRQSNVPVILPILAIINIASGFGYTTTEEQITHVDSSIGYETVGFTETQIHEENTVINNPNYKLGDEFTVEKGDSAYYDAGLREGTQKVMDETGFYREYKYEGEYRITGFAISDRDGHVLDYVQDFEETQAGYALFELEQKVANERGLAYEDMRIIFHLGSNNDHSRLGWMEVDYADTIPYATVEDIVKNVTFTTFFTGTQDDFDGEHITLSNGVTLKVTDDLGNLLYNGADVIGSDGQHYMIRDLNLTEKTIVDSVLTNKKLTYNINYPVLNASMLALFASILYDVKKRQELKNKNPDIFKFRDDERKHSFIHDFEKAREEYNKKNRFGKLLKRIFLGSSYQVLQNLNQEQIDELYGKILTYVGPQYQIGFEDTVEFHGGKIYIRYKDGRILDITDEAMKFVKDIGKDNPVSAKGMVDDEIRRGY